MKPRVIALSGGIGGAKLALGLARALRPGELVLIANTADDFEHCGYYICPDIDTLLYTLGGVVNRETGWGRADETWSFMAELRETSPGEAWFQLGDKDLQTHRFRTEAMAAGHKLTEVTQALTSRFDIEARILPMSDEAVRTYLLADDGRWLPFQEYFVRLRCEPPIRRIEYHGAEAARVPPALSETLDMDSADAIIICPSNPFLSIDPILSVPGLAGRLKRLAAPVVAVSPVVGGLALKGPTAKIMREMGMKPDVLSIARHYSGLIDGLVIDREDRDFEGRLASTGLKVGVTGTVMNTLEDRDNLARFCLEFAAPIRASRTG